KHDAHCVANQDDLRSIVHEDLGDADDVGDVLVAIDYHCRLPPNTQCLKYGRTRFRPLCRPVSRKSYTSRFQANGWYAMRSTSTGGEPRDTTRVGKHTVLPIGNVGNNTVRFSKEGLVHERPAPGRSSPAVNVPWSMNPLDAPR